ncbi:MAG: serpin family protein [Aestuariibaculum sp.]
MKNNVIGILVFLTTMIACQKSDIENTPEIQPAKSITLPSQAKKVLNANNNFGVSMFSNIAKEEQENIMLSPLSANIALSMLLNAADGNTFSQIRNMLNYEGLTQSEINELYKTLTEQLLTADEKVTLNLANALFFHNTFPVKDSYKTAIQTTYNAEIEDLDFTNSANTLKKVNDWASNKTNGKIEKVLNSVSPDAIAFLLNAVYFKGDWTQKFEKDNTQNQTFTLHNGSTINVPTMNGKIPLKAYFGNHFSAYELSYGRNNFVMDIILPSGTLPEFLSNFNGNLYKEITTRLDQQENKTEYHVKLPKFKFKYKKKLNSVLRALGMIDAFIPGTANLSHFSDVPIFISFVKQNTYIDVNEEGSEAAAVTTIGIETVSSPEPKSVHFNKPFLFGIRERTTNTLLFIGTVYNPLEDGN